MDKFLSYIGLARKAGLAGIGTEEARSHVRCGKAKLLVSSAEAAESAKKRARDMASHFKVLHIETAYTMEQLGKAAGRAPAAMLTIDDDGIAKAAMKQLKGDN